MKLDRNSYIPATLSVGIHAFLIGLLILIGQGATKANQIIQLDIVTTPRDGLAPVDMTKKRGSERAKGTLAQASKSSIKRKIFGVSMDSVTFGDVGQGEAVLPVGDTLMKDPEKTPVPLNDLTEMPTIRSEVKAPYPPEALLKKIEGKVILELLIDSQGYVTAARVVRPAGHGFDEAALKAVKEFIFSPARIQGRAVSAKITYTYTFILD